MGCACDNYNRHKQELARFSHHHHDDCNCNNHDDSCGCGHHHSDDSKEKTIFFIRIVVSALLLVLSMFLRGWFLNTTLIVSYVVIAYDIMLNAFKNIIKGKIFDENFLMLLASLTAIIVFIINPDSGIDGFDGVLVALLYQLGEYIQHRAVDKSKKSITNMLSLDIEKVIKVVNDKEFISNANTIKVNDVIKVLPGEKIPTDGIIINGSSTINTSMLTGESKPLEVYVNDKVVSGCINNDGVLYIKALTTVDESTSSKVMKMIKEASKNKASSERFITKFAKYYTPIVILIALIVMFIIPMFIGFNEHFTNYLYKGLSIMVISCPCALVISIPLSYFMGIGKSARYSILVKGSSYIETLANIKAIAFDKTGTITKGNFKVTHIQSTDIKLMESLLYSCELNFTHPIATSIVNSLSNAEKLDVYDVKNIPGYGIKALYKSKEILIGNEKLLKDNNVLFDSVNSSLSIIYVSYNNLYLGYIVIEDELKDDAISSINDLSLNYQLHLISGDKKEIVNDIASKVNIKSVYYQQLPEDKVNVINNIKENNSVAYVGDGINDAACLLNASVGIAMKSLGSDIAIQASDIVIMDDKISSINKAIKISKKTMKTVITNIIMSIFIKVSVMVLTMIFTLPMWVAILADVGVCLLAILNSLTIMYGKYDK